MSRCRIALALVLVAAPASGQDPPPPASAPESPPESPPETPPESPGDSELELFQLEQKMEQVVLAAKRPQPLREAAASVSVITAEDLAAFGWRDFTEAIASLAGFYTTDPRDYTYIGTRGVSQHSDFNGRLLVMVDGHAQQELWSHAFYPELAGLDAALIDHIEVLRGPSSALFGSLGFVGVVNVVTRRGTADEWARVGVDLSSAAFGLRGTASVGHRFRNGLELGLSISATGELGGSYSYPDLTQNQLCYEQFQRSCTNGVSDRATDRMSAVAAYGHLEWKGLSLKLSYQFEDKHIPFAPYRTIFNDPINRFAFERAYLDLGYTLGRPSLLQAQARAYLDYHTYLDDLAYTDDGTHSTYYTFRDESHPIWAGGELKLLLEREWNKLFLAVTAGGDFTYLYADNQSGVAGGNGRVYNPQPVGAECLDPKGCGISIQRALLFGAGYAQAELSYARKIFLTAGLRADVSDLFPWELSPRAGLVLRPYPTGTFKLLYSHGFIRPSWYQTFFNDGRSIIDNQRLGPERADNGEIVFQQELGPFVSLTASAFYIRAHNLIGIAKVCVPATAEVPESPDCPPMQSARAQRQNGATFDSLGTELGLTGRFKEGGRFYGNYSFARVTDGSGERPFNSPEHLFKLGVSFPLWKNHLSAGLETRVISSRRYDFSSGQTAETEPVYLIHVFVTWNGLPKGVQASLKLYNTFGQTYYDPVQSEDGFPVTRAPHAGPSATLRMSYTF